ncbi:MAG: exosortase/archaeosortase family protein [Phycisphaerales bacterium]|nr:exosortase/archaeosortase family protein [Phycisphaerales bacterium]
MSNAAAARRWTPWHALGALALVAAAVYVTRGAWIDIAHIAFADEESSHIFLVPMVAAWIFWVRRTRLRHCLPTGQYVGPLLIAVGWLMHWYGYEHAVQTFWHGGAVLIAIGAALSVLGKHVLFRFLPAFVVLLFLVPVPGMIRQEISIPLQTASSAVTQVALEVFGVPVERTGNLLTINNFQVTVAEACNGMRMVFALWLVTYAFAFGMPLRNWVRVVVLVASPIAAIACNVARLIPTVLLYGYAPTATADTFHSVSGWLMLPLAFLVLLGILRVLRWALIPVTRFNLAYQ